MKLTNFFKTINGFVQLGLIIISIVYLWQTLLWVSVAWIITLGISICIAIATIKEEE